MHDVPPTTTSIIRGLLFWIPLRNPPGSLLDGRPTIDSQLTGGLLQSAHNTCARPKHCTIRVSTIYQVVAERIRLDDLCERPTSLLHVFSPCPEFFEMLVNPAVGGDQGITAATASVEGSDFVLVNEMMDQVVPQKHQFPQIILSPGEVRVR